MFIGTHLPKIPEPLESNIPDKSLHGMAFAGLGFLLALRKAAGGTWRWWDSFWLLALIALYGGCDELTQIPVGRTADWHDWYADLLGGSLGLLAFIAAEFAWRKFFRGVLASPTTHPA